MENRKLSRIDFLMEVEFLNKGMSVKGQVINLSLNGALIVVPEENDIALGNQLEVKLYINSQSTNLEIALQTVVIRKDKNSIGLKFGLIDLESFIHLRNIVAYNSGDYDMIMDEFARNNNN